MTSQKAHDLQCLTIDHLEKLAAERMDKQTRDYYNEGADSGTIAQLAMEFSYCQFHSRNNQ